MIYKRSAPSLHSNASQGVDVALWKPWVESWSHGSMWEHCHERLHPTCGSGDIHLPKTNFPRGQSDFELSKRLAAMFQLVPGSTPFAYFLSFEESLGKTSWNRCVKTGSDSCISASPAAPAELSEHSSGLCLKSALWPGVKLLTLSSSVFQS